LAHHHDHNFRLLFSFCESFERENLRSRHHTELERVIVRLLALNSLERATEISDDTEEVLEVFESQALFCDAEEEALKKAVFD